MKWINVILEAIGLARDLATKGGRRKVKPRFLPKSNDKPIVPRGDK